MSIYQTSTYDKNQTTKFFPIDTENLQYENSIRKYPNSKTTKYYQENPIEYSFNNYGFRTPDNFNHDDDGNIFLGCSHTIGIGHHLENTWSYKLNKFMGGKFWNLSQGGTGVDTAFRLLYGFKDYLNGKNIFHYAPIFHSYRYEFIIDSQPIILNMGWPKSYSHIVGDKFVEESLVDDRVAKLGYDKSILAIESMAQDMNCNYYLLNEDVMDINDEDSIGARDFAHYTIDQQQQVYDSFLNII